MSKLKTMTLDDLFSVPVPQATETYVPISNRRLISTLHSMVKESGYKITGEEYTGACGGDVMIGKIRLSSIGDEIGMMMAVGNSYNKARRVSIVSGGVVFACLNGMFAGEFVKMRKHTGKINEDLESIIGHAIETLDRNYQRLVVDAQKMKEVMIDKRIAGQLIGDMYFNHQIMNSVQLNMIKKEMQFSENFKMVKPEEYNLWNLYNNITHSLKITYPLNYVSAHKNLHAYMTSYMRNGCDLVEQQEIVEEVLEEHED